MQLKPTIKKLRNIFPEIRIRQLSNEFNCTYALFLLPQCGTEFKLIFEHDFLALHFGKLKSFYGSSRSDFDFMISEISGLIQCKTCVMSVYSDGKYLGCMLAYDDEITQIFLAKELQKFHFEVYNSSVLKTGYIELNYCDSNFDKTIPFSKNIIFSE